MYKFCVNSTCLVTWLIDGRRACLCITTSIKANLSRYGVCGTSTCLVSRLSDGHWHIDDLFVHALRDALLELFRSLWHCHIDDLGALCHRLESAFTTCGMGMPSLHMTAAASLWRARRRSRNCCSTSTSPPVSSTEGSAQCLNKHLPRLCHGHSSPCQHSGTHSLAADLEQCALCVGSVESSKNIIAQDRPQQQVVQ